MQRCQKVSRSGNGSWVPTTLPLDATQSVQDHTADPKQNCVCQQIKRFLEIPTDGLNKLPLCTPSWELKRVMYNIDSWDDSGMVPCGSGLGPSQKAGMLARLSAERFMLEGHRAGLPSKPLYHLDACFRDAIQ